MVLGQIFLGEAITLIQMLGAGLVLAGVLIISLKPQAARSTHPCASAGIADQFR